MEKDSPSKPSVAELAGRLKGHILPMPTSNDEFPFRRRPPCSLKLQNQNEKNDNEDSDKTIVSPNPFKIKMKNSAIIEKLQANLALSPTALLPSPKSPEAKLQPEPLSPTSPCRPLSPLSPTLRSSHQSVEEEDPVSFSDPPEGNPLPSFNKTRARLSFKRRPPTRQHRRSAGEEAGALASPLSPCELNTPRENGDVVFDSPAEEGEHGRPCLKEAKEKQRDCENTGDEMAQSDPDSRRGLEEEQEAERDLSLEALVEEQQPSDYRPAKQIEDGVGTEEMAEEEHKGGNEL